MKTWHAVAAAIPALVLLAGCVGYSVRYDYDPAAPFANLHTFSWYQADASAQERPDRVNDSIMDRRVRRLVEAELTARGYQRVSEGTPDFLVAYHPVFRDRVVASTIPADPWWGYGWDRPWLYGPPAGFTELEVYREGSLVLDLVDARNHRLIWQAVAEGALTGFRDPQDAEEQLGRTVKKMLERFPPPPRASGP